MAQPIVKPGARHHARRAPKGGRVSYRRDLYGWVEEQVTLLRAGRVDDIDVVNIAEELSDVGSEQYDKLESAAEVLLMHLLKWDHQPEKRSRSWVLTIAEQRKRVERQLRRNPSLKARLKEAIEEGFETGRLRAAREADLDLGLLPQACPYSFDEMMRRDIGLEPD